MKARGLARAWVLFLGAALLLALPIGVSASSNAGVRIVLITLDTLRRDHFVPGEDGASAMPRVFARAASGVRFSRFFVTSPVTQPSHASMLTGRHPWEHGVTRNGQELHGEIASLAPTLQRAGFENHAVVASFPLSARFGFGAGFDSYTEEFTSKLGKKGTWEKEWKVPDERFFSDGSFITRKAIETLDAASTAKQFFWFHYFDAHAPYGSSLGKNMKAKDILEPERRRGATEAAALERARGLYRADVGHLDRELDRLLARLARDAERFPTHVFVVADHGESFGEDGYLGHGERLSDEQLRVPAFLLSPLVEPALRDDVTSGIDVARTLLGLAGEPPPNGVGGRDLLARAGGQPGAFGMRRTHRTGSHREKLLGGVRVEVKGELFFAAQPDGRLRRGNGSALAPEDEEGLSPAERRSLEQLFLSFEAALHAPRSETALDPATRRALEALGYVE